MHYTIYLVLGLFLTILYYIVLILKLSGKKFMVYVLNKDKVPLMPCSNRKARLLLSTFKAKVIHNTPFTIQLIFGSSGYKQPIIAGLDSGSAIVGSAAVSNSNVIYQAEINLRNDISTKLTQRKMFRKTRRARKTRYRQARFSNRSASLRKGRLPPSILSKINSHLREIKFIASILPVTYWKFELASFDIHKITNPSVSGKDYQLGSQKDFYNVKQYVLHRDNYQCHSGQKLKHSKKLNVHHIKFKSNGGSNTPTNLITLCETCHENLHNGQFEFKSKKSKTKHATEMGIIKSQLSKYLMNSTFNYEITFGYETKYKRETFLQLPKTHANDAIAICLNDGDLIEPINKILIKNHIAKGDYKQSSGAHSQIKIPTGKLFGFRKGDKVMTSKGIGFIKGKRTSGYFSIANLDNNIIHNSEKIKYMTRLSARTTTQIEELNLNSLIIRRKEKEFNMANKKLKNTIVLHALNDMLSHA